MRIHVRTAVAVAAAVLTLTLNARVMAGAQQPQGGQPAAPRGPLAPEKYKNIQVLKDVPADQVDGIMRFMSASLGVHCDFCHVASDTGTWPMDKDDKKNKQTARTMVTMMNAINAANFDGKPTVNCASCHHGRNEPDRLPPLAVELTADQIAAAAARAQFQPQNPPPARGDAPPAGRGAPGGPAGRGGPPRPTETIDQVLDAYLQALGGRAAVEKVTSRVMRGSVTDRAGQASPILVEEKAPRMVRQSIDSKPAPSTWASDGAAAWAQEGSNTWVLSTALELQDVSRLADLTLPLSLKERYQNLQVTRYARLDGREMIIVTGRSAPTVTEQFYFDRQTGLLARRVIGTRTFYGNLPEQIDYSDYRDVSGVKTPFQIRRATWESVLNAKFADVKVNVPVDAARFAKPAGAGH
jgi:hypothetical protein